MRFLLCPALGHTIDESSMRTLRSEAGVLYSALCEDAPARAAPPGSVTQEILDAKIQEVEAAFGLEEEARTKVVELYRNALSNLYAAGANARAAETAPAEV